ncbi:LysE family translocator [Vibrio kyushuensis]|uniref:LysE family translocator n=1 Tax=Vibrio TaxID=662 RepID=UPI003D0CE48B
MSISSSIALFIAMLLSAVIPGPSVLAVVSRTLSSGALQGLLVVAGVLIADYIFICLAITGLATVASQMGEFASVIKYVGIVYLFWLAYSTWHSKSTGSQDSTPINKNKSQSSLMAGLLMTLANPKAVLFYMGFFPAFVNLGSISTQDVLLIMFISTLSVGGVLSIYVFSASKARYLFASPKSKRLLNKISGGALATCGIALASRS